MRPTLEELAIKYNCDKYYAHSYIPFYSKLFERWRERAVTLFEIGIGYEDLMKPFVPRYTHGSSLYMWKEYFEFPYIYACDIREDVLITDPVIETFLADQSSIQDVWKMIRQVGVCDFIIDDGSHEVEHQIFTASILVPWIMPGGAYIIEDVREPMKVAAALGGEIYKFDKRPDDCLVVIRR